MQSRQLAATAAPAPHQSLGPRSNREPQNIRPTSGGSSTAVRHLDPSGNEGVTPAKSDSLRALAILDKCIQDIKSPLKDLQRLEARLAELSRAVPGTSSTAAHPADLPSNPTTGMQHAVADTPRAPHQRSSPPPPGAVVVLVLRAEQPDEGAQTPSARDRRREPRTRLETAALLAAGSTVPHAPRAEGQPEKDSPPKPSLQSCIAGAENLPQAVERHRRSSARVRHKPRIRKSVPEGI